VTDTPVRGLVLVDDVIVVPTTPQTAVCTWLFSLETTESIAVFRSVFVTTLSQSPALSWIVRTVKSALSRRAVVDLPAGEKLVAATEASAAEIDKLADGVAP